MKRNLGPLSLLTTGLLLLNSVPALSQQQVAALRRDDATTSEARKTGFATPEECRAEISRLQSRKSALQKYISTVDPASDDFLTTARSVRELDLRLKELDETLQTLGGGVSVGQSSILDPPAEQLLTRTSRGGEAQRPAAAPAADGAAITVRRCTRAAPTSASRPTRAGTR